LGSRSSVARRDFHSKDRKGHKDKPFEQELTEETEDKSVRFPTNVCKTLTSVGSLFLFKAVRKSNRELTRLRKTYGVAGYEWARKDKT
jgi:hypothetical protein